MSDGAIKYVGVDGCPCGWIGVGLDDSGVARVKVRGEFSEILECFGDACLILVDMPIGLPNGVPTYRCCDNEARRKLKGRESSVFRVPSREFVTEFKNSESRDQTWGYSDANKWITDKCQGAKLISQQAFHIVEKIIKVDDALTSRDESASPKVREAHPEICFWALNNKNVVLNSKKDGWGFIERFRIVKRLIPNTDVNGVFEKVRREHSKSQVGSDDVLDALALAVTAKIGSQEGNEFRTLPKRCNGCPKEKDKCKPNLPMEMVYALPNDTQAASGSEK